MFPNGNSEKLCLHRSFLRVFFSGKGKRERAEYSTIPLINCALDATFLLL